MFSKLYFISFSFSYYEVKINYINFNFPVEKIILTNSTKLFFYLIVIYKSVYLITFLINLINIKHNLCERKFFLHVLYIILNHVTI